MAHHESPRLDRERTLVWDAPLRITVIRPHFTSHVKFLGRTQLVAFAVGLVATQPSCRSNLAERLGEALPAPTAPTPRDGEERTGSAPGDSLDGGAAGDATDAESDAGVPALALDAGDASVDSGASGDAGANMDAGRVRDRDDPEDARAPTADAGPKEERPDSGRTDETTDGGR